MSVTLNIEMYSKYEQIFIIHLFIIINSHVVVLKSYMYNMYQYT